MNVGIYVCVILAALSSGSLSLPAVLVRAESMAHLRNSLHAPSPNRRCRVRSAPVPPSVLHRYHDSIYPLSHHNHFYAPQHANNPPTFLDRLVHRQIPPPLLFWGMPQQFPRKKKT